MNVDKTMSFSFMRNSLWKLWSILLSLKVAYGLYRRKNSMPSSSVISLSAGKHVREVAWKKEKKKEVSCVVCYLMCWSSMWWWPLLKILANTFLADIITMFYWPIQIVSYTHTPFIFSMALFWPLFKQGEDEKGYWVLQIKNFLQRHWFEDLKQESNLTQAICLCILFEAIKRKIKSELLTVFFFLGRNQL